MRLGNTVVVLSELDVVGQDGETSFVRHLGLAASKGSIDRANVPVHDMGPPLRSPGDMQVDVHGRAELDDNEMRKIKSFVERHASEHAARDLSSGTGILRGYCVHPHVLPQKESDGTVLYQRFSCAGFVVEAYRFARINLLDLDHIPPVSLDSICKAYPEIANELRNRQNTRARVGLQGDGPWGIVFCGYIVHALNRSAQDIRNTRFTPAASHAWFQ